MPDPFILCLILLVTIACLGLPIGLSMLASSIFYLLLTGLDLGTAAEQVLNGLYGSYVLLAVPLFILAADFMNTGSLTDRLLHFCLLLVGRFRGGLGHVNVLLSIIFAGMSGSAVADAVGLGRIIIGMMVRDGKYPVAYAAAITAASAVIGPIVPPSIPMVIYALVSDASIGYLFLGGVVPGLLLGVVFMFANGVISHIRKFPVEEAISIRELPKVTKDAFPALMLPVILLFGIYGGVMTPTEGSAAAAAYALLAASLFYRAISLNKFYNVLRSSAKTSTAIGMLFVGAIAFNYVVTIENIPLSVQHFIAGFNLTATGFLLLVNVLILGLGCLLEGSTILLVIVPILIPTAKHLGIDLVHFGVVIVINTMLGLVTPPFGLLLFVVANITKQPLMSVVRESLPFLLMALLVLLLMVFVPGTVLWLPRMMGYTG